MALNAAIKSGTLVLVFRDDDVIATNGLEGEVVQDYRDLITAGILKAEFV